MCVSSLCVCVNGQMCGDIPEHFQGFLCSIPGDFDMLTL